MAGDLWVLCLQGVAVRDFSDRLCRMNKKMLFFVVALPLLTPPATAMAGDSSRMEYLSDELQLTADQKARLEAIFNEKHERYRAIREETQTRIRDVLSEEQLDAWNKLKKQSFDRRHGGMGGLEQ
ncbi:MAG: hypothetical protein PHW13_00355 [Methylococcales bacterium]|nr:hypothetical protein [Methylococcales bacterium]